jgi:hypothetical protein
LGEQKTADWWAGLGWKRQIQLFQITRAFHKPVAPPMRITAADRRRNQKSYGLAFD